MAFTQAKARLVEDIERHFCIADILEEILISVGETLQPEDVFDESQLDEWAVENGYTKADEAEEGPQT